MKINEVYCEDNLSFLKKIDDEIIDFIYCDILYGTGRNFGSYIDIRADKEIVFSFYLPRILEFYRVLKNTGSIVFQMDKRINHWIRNLFDDVFGYQNFRNEITWCYSGGGVSSTKFSPKSDVLIWYSKSEEYTFNKQFIPYTGEQKAHPYSKNREEKSLRGKHLEDWWIDINSFGGSTNHPERREIGYPTQKPELLMKRVVDTWTNEGDLVADFFMGSGTFIYVANKLNRNFLGCDILEDAVKITKKRLTKKE